MNIVYLIGNGFDRNLGLKTSYQDFYQYYQQQPSSTEDILKIKQLMKNEPSEFWSDLELALGRITTEFDDAIRFVKALQDISDNLIYDFVKDLSFANNRAQDRGLYRREAKLRLAMHKYNALQNSIYCDTNTDMFNFGNSIQTEELPYNMTISKVG